MTRKDFVAIAAALAAARTTTNLTPNIMWRNTGVAAAASHIADVMAADNPRFDRARFLKAAGVQS